MGNGFREIDAGALACFRQAALTCGDASLLVGQSGVDSGFSAVIALRRVNSACAVSVASQSFVAPRPPNPIDHFDCGQIHVDGTGETVDCGKGGQFSIPAHVG